MAAERFTLDTNILFYSMDAFDKAKHNIARLIIGNSNPRTTPLLLQALCELHNATSKHQPSLLHEAEAFLEKTRRLFNIIPTTLDDLVLATELQRRYPLQFFDALLLAIATRASCALFLSEDMQDGQTYGALTVRNPFKMSDADLTALLA